MQTSHNTNDARCWVDLRFGFWIYDNIWIWDGSQVETQAHADFLVLFGISIYKSSEVGWFWRPGSMPFCDQASGERGQEGPSPEQEHSKETQHLGGGSSQEDAPDPIAENLDAFQHPKSWDAKS